MKCAKCGSENSPGAKFCRGCGSKLEVTEPVMPANIAACPKCGNINEPGKKFCAKCGAPAVAISAPIPAATKLNAPPSPPIATPPPAVSLPKHAKVQPAPAKESYTMLIVGVVVVVLLLGILGGGGYWYYQQQETEKAIALQKQQKDEARLKAEAAAKAEEAYQLAAQVARLEAEKRVQAEQQQLLQAQAQAQAQAQQQLQQSRLQQQRELLEQQQQANVRSSQQQQQQGCATGPDVGWKAFIAKNLTLNDRGTPGSCMDIALPDGVDKVKIYFYRVPRVVRGRFILRTQNGFCNSEIRDNCLGFISNNLKTTISLEGKRFFIQTGDAQ